MYNPVKLKFYYDHVLSTVYDEGESPFHQDITKDVVSRFIDPKKLPVTSKIIDLGCGPGYFLDEMKQRGYTNVQGVTLSPADVAICQRNGHNVKKTDMNFLDDKDESVDMLFCRHSIEHSPFPYITLLEYNRVLKPNGYLYIEVPSLASDRPHETNKNHYSILDKRMWISLLQRTGFDAEWFDYEFPVSFIDGSGTYMERYYVFMCRRKRSADIK
jgi:SAM-dependent methyltransferase